MTVTRRLRFGIKTAPQHTTYDDILRVWQEADAQPALEHAWVFDHFMPLGSDPTGPCLEGWTLLAALATRTERLRVGVMVTGNTYRHPAVLANIGATVDRISHGRLDMGLGAGWNEREHTAYGIPLYAPGERIRRMGEACEVLQRMWTEEAPDFDGHYYHLRSARCEPKPVQRPRPPLVIGGSGEKLTLRMVARYADIWNCLDRGPEDFAAKSAILDQHCAAVGRDPTTIERSTHIPVDPDHLDEARDMVRTYQALGVSHIILNLRAPYPPDICRHVAEEIAAPLMAET